MTIAAVLQTKGSDVVTVPADMPVTEALSLLADRRIGALPVLEEGRIAGIFSERDILYGLRADGAAFLQRRVGDTMTSPVISITPETAILAALALMTKRRIRHLPVVASEDYDAALVGFVSIGDLVKYRIEAIERDADAMRSYIQGS